MGKASFEDLICNLPKVYKWEVVLTEAIASLSDKTDSKGIMTFVLSMETAFQNNEPPEDLSLVSLKEASQITAIFQIREAEFREQLSDFIKRVKNLLIQCVLSGMV